jgi:hypothetical protein
VFVEANYVHPFSIAEFEYGEYFKGKQEMNFGLLEKDILRGSTKAGR